MEEKDNFKKKTKKIVSNITQKSKRRNTEE